MPTWYLEDIVAAARANPDSFFIPSAQARDSCREGDLVRLHFMLGDPREGQPRAERMWVEVTDRMRDEAGWCYRGVLDNEPAYIADLTLGDVIEFRASHVARTLLTPGDPGYLSVGEKKAIVSALALEAGRHACWAYREAADRPEDSGWRLYRGDETDAFVEDADNARLCDVYWLVERDPTLFQIFHAEVDCAFERVEESGDWQPVSDWNPSGS